MEKPKSCESCLRWAKSFYGCLYYKFALEYSDKCPCRNCLVKPTCNKASSCKEFMTLAGKYADEIRGRLK
jgi:hypothetical protein